MADAVTSTVMNDGMRNYSIKMTNFSDGTGESAVKKIDISTLAGPVNATAPSCFAIKSVQYDIGGFQAVKILFDATTDDVGLLLTAGQGFLDYESDNHIVDPKSTGTTGDIMLTTVGAAADASYDITLNLIKKA